MKSFAFLAFALCLASCAPNATSTNASEKTETATATTAQNFDWLLGSWLGELDAQGSQTYESWKKESENRYIGGSYTMMNADTASQESMALFKAQNDWMLEVIQPGEAMATAFRVVAMDDKSFVCENKEIEFPQVIHYVFEDGKIKASISNDEMSIPFEYTKVK